MVCEIGLVRAVDIHEIDLLVAVTPALEGDLRAVGGEGGLVVKARVGGQASDADPSAFMT